VTPFTYLEPSSLDEALALLARHGGEAKLIAGGTGLVNLMKQRLVRPGFVIGLRALKPLAGIAEGLRVHGGELLPDRHFPPPESPDTPVPGTL